MTVSRFTTASDPPDLLEESEGDGRQRSTALAVLAAIASLAAVHFAKLILLPVLLAVLVSLLLRAPVGFLQRLRLPRSVAAALALAAIGGGLTLGLAQLTEPAARWVDKAPTTLGRLETRLRSVRGSVEEVNKAAAQVQEMTELDSSSSKAPKVQVEERSPAAAFFDRLAYLVSTTVVVLFLVYLLLVFGDDLMSQAFSLIVEPEKRDQANAVALRIEQDVSRYLLTITMINAGLGLSVAVVCLMVGLPSPWLWGAMAALLNYVPYLGGLAGVVIVAAVALTSVEPASRALLAPLLYGVLTTLEGMLITPVIVGRRFAMNPLVVFVWLLAWGWLWGIAGMLIAIPLLTIVRVLVDHVPAWRRLAPLLAR